ncbi:MAG: 5'/3'-nucleotidase SurE [Bacteroidales bacterium]|nr:5'/3'-nucleotidase SurE [Bacteroidales bacterium]
MTSVKPLILVTNDDGITAPGIRKLISIMHSLGEVVVVAPDKPQSAMGHAITVTTPLMVHQIPNENNHPEYSCNGTSVDCVKMGVKIVLDRKPDLVVSGINHGSNASINVLYSGTMAAAIEAAIEDIPAIGFSLNDYSIHANFDGFEEYIKTIVKQVLKNGLPPATCLNVNIPASGADAIRGIKVVRQAKGYWKETYDARTDPFKRSYYWLTGVFEDRDGAEDTDVWAITNNYIAVVPVHIDMTAHAAIVQLKQWDLEK